LTKTDLFYEGRFMGSFGSPWITHNVAFMCYICGRKFAERTVSAPRDFWSFDTGACAKCAKEKGNEVSLLSVVYFRLGGELRHPFECPLLDSVQFIYEAESLLGVTNERKCYYGPDECSFQPRCANEQLCLATCPENPAHGR